MDPAAPKPPTQTPAPQPPAKPDTGGGQNGDNSKINGDQPIQNLPSNQIVQEKQMAEAAQMQATHAAQAATAQQAPNGTAAPSFNVSQGAKDSNGQSYDQIRKLGELVEKAALPDELRKQLDERISRLALIRSGSGYTSSTYIIEYEATQRYINWVTGMPWHSKSEDILDLKKAREILDKHHYGLEMLKQRMLEYIASIMLNIQNNGADYATRSPVLCFVGLAGTGKTTFAISMAEALGRQFERIPFGGMADSRVLRGQSRYFPDAEPGQVIKRLVHAKTRNPVLLFDEVDRVTETARSDIMGVLIELLDPEQNSSFADHYIDFPFSLSNCLFVATSNNMTSVSTAVADRMEIIQMPSYNDEEKTVIGRDYVLPKTKKIIGLKEEQFAIDPAVWQIIIRPLGYDPGVRGLERLINMMCRKAAKIIVSGEAKNVRITPDNVKRFTSEV